MAAVNAGAPDGATELCDAPAPPWRDWLLAAGGVLVLTNAFDNLMYHAFGPGTTLLPGLPAARALLLPVFVAAAVLLADDPRGAARQARAAWPLWPVIALAFASVAWSDQPATTALWAAALLGTSAFGIALATRFSPRGQCAIVAATVALLALANALAALLWPAFATTERGHWIGLFGHKNLLGRVMALGVVASVVGAANRRARMPALLALLLCGGLTVASRSRASALAALIAVVATIALLAARAWRRHATVILAGGTAVAVLVSVFLVLAEPGRFAQSRGRTLSARTNLWQAVAAGAEERAWLGHGYGAFWRGPAGQKVIATTGFGTSHAHNGFLDLYAELGLLGTALVIVPLAFLAVAAFRHALEWSGHACLWPATYLVFFIASNVAESGLLTHKAYWALYVAVACHVMRVKSPGGAGGSAREGRAAPLPGRRAGTPAPLRSVVYAYRFILPIAALGALQAGSALASPLPRIPAVATVVDPERFPDAYVRDGIRTPPFIPVAITGEGLRSENEASLLVRTGDCATSIQTLSVLERDRCGEGKPLPCVIAWTDTRVVLQLPHHLSNVALQFGAGGACIPVEYYRYDWFATNAGTGDFPGVPLALTVDAQHRVWINEEFHLDLRQLSPSHDVVRTIPIPHPVVPPFASNLFARDAPSQISALGEDVVVDPEGRIWFTEGGGHLYGTLYSGNHPNHSRIIMYDPRTAETRVYNVPGNDNQIMGLAFDRRCTDGASTGRWCGDGTSCPAGQSCAARIWFTEVARRAAKIFVEPVPGPCDLLCAPAGLKNRITREVLPPRLAWFSAEPGTTPHTVGRAANFEPGLCVVRARVCANHVCTGDDDCGAACESGVCADGSDRACAVATDCSGTCDTGLCSNWTCAHERDCDGTCRAGVCSDNSGRSCTPATAADCRGLCLARGHCAQTRRPCLRHDDCALEKQVCDWSSRRPDCFFREFPLPGASTGEQRLPDFFEPAHLLVGSDGAIWYTGWGGGNHIGRLAVETCDRATPHSCTVQIFPLPAARGTHHAVPMLGAGPWQLVQVANGDIVFTEFFDNTISRFHVARLADPQYDCRRLDSGGRNPCVTEAWIPVTDSAAVQVHSVALDEEGRLWFTQSADLCFQSDRAAESSIGYVRYPTAHTPEVILFPPLSLYEFNVPPGFCKGDTFRAFVGTGIAIDRDTDEIWFGDLLRRRIGRMRKVTQVSGKE